MEYVLVTQGLSKHYKDFKALDNLTMHVPKGSIYGFVGRNGAGKTTFIKLLCRLYEPTEGVITLNGIDIRKYREEEYRELKRFWESGGKEP